MAHTRAERRWFREVKGMRRLKEDRNQHRIYGQKSFEDVCHCFASRGSKEFGKIFSRFADTPAGCSCYMCRNRRQDEGESISERRHKSVVRGDE